MDAIDIMILLGAPPCPNDGAFTCHEDLREPPISQFSAYNFPWLYALAKNGNLRTYRIEVSHFSDHSIVSTLKATTEGGKWQIDSYEYREGVNIGKSNETTFSEQAMNEASSMYKKLLDKGFSPDKPKKGAKFNTDARGFMKPMLARKFSEREIRFPCIVQPKYDGVRCMLFEHEGKIHIQSRQGKPYNIPHLEKWAKENTSLLPLDGELYNHGELSFQEITSAVKKVGPLTKSIRYVVYDRPITDVNNNDRWMKLTSDFSAEEKGAPVYLSDWTLCCSMKHIWEYHKECVSKGYEGVIIRNIDGEYEFGFRSNNLIKLKTFDDSEFEIVDVVEATGRDVGTAIFVCECSGGIFNVKPQGTRELRREYWLNRKSLIGKFVSVQYQGLSDDGIPRFPSAITIRDYE